MFDLKCEESFQNKLMEKGIPNHIAIIMDGNRRWARLHRKPLMMGHKKGADTLYEIVKDCISLGVEVLTVYAFSTENWNRTEQEVSYIMRLLKLYLIKQRTEMKKEGVRLSSIGNIKALPDTIQKELEKTRLETKDGKKLDLVIAINYGSRDEICRASKNLGKDLLNGTLSLEAINEEVFSSYLDTNGFDDPELYIRPGGEMRVSNFLLWQSSYSEIVSIECLWPDFTKKELMECILEFQKRKRRWGR